MGSFGWVWRYNIPHKLTYLLLISAVLFYGCTTKDLAPRITFFSVVNQTGQDVKVRLLADGAELFTVEIGTEVDLPGGISPPGAKYPTRELKAPLRQDIKAIKVQELVSGMEKEWRVTGKVDTGFLITVKRGEILFQKGYVPVR